MSLPKVNQIEYGVELPISKQKVKFHPFTVKEQRTLLLALEDGSAEVIGTALINITQWCLLDEIDVKTLAGPDLEWLFLQIRMKSVGETSQVRFTCEECDSPNDYEIDLTNVQLSEGDMEAGKIMLDDKVGMTLAPPSFGTVERLLEGKEELDVETLFSLVGECVDNIFDEEFVHNRADFEEDELQVFIDSLSSENFDKISAYFEQLPKLSYTVNYKCNKEGCGHENEVELVGLANFFG
jgi:hypothetical protein